MLVIVCWKHRCEKDMWPFIIGFGLEPNVKKMEKFLLDLCQKHFVFEIKFQMIWESFKLFISFKVLLRKMYLLVLNVRLIERYYKVMYLGIEAWYLVHYHICFQVKGFLARHILGQALLKSISNKIFTIRKNC